MEDGQPTAAVRSYRSGPIEIDLVRRLVLIGGAPARLGARAFDVLLTLVERRERVVSKNELMDVVWPKVVVEENNLLVHMVALRKLLGPRAIATIPGRGYRFTMPIDVCNSGIVAESPPSRGNLPYSAPLFGRAQDVDAVHELLSGHPVVTIVGAGGIGKTRVAMAVTTSAGAEWPDGRWWVELASINEGAQVPNAIAVALAIQLSTGRPPQEALAVALATRKLLLVLDSCEHLTDDIAVLVDLLRAHATNVRVLVTSQESLKCRDEQVYRLSGLAVPATAQLEAAVEFGAVGLFVERAHAVDPRFRLGADNVAVVIDICRRLDGIPLAIELAAARIPLLGVHGLHARLNQMFNVLSGGTRMKLRRHQTLRAALDWSHGLLSADEKAVFRRLGVFAGGFTLELAQQVVSDAGIDQWLVLDLLGHLVDKSLVIVDTGADLRYRLLETTRAFALEQLAAAGESETMLQRHAQAVCDMMTDIDSRCWTVSFAEQRGIIHELGNLRAALDWTVNVHCEEGQALAYELLGKCWLAWIINGLIHEGVQRMLKLWPLPANLPPRVEADFCLALARLNQSTGREEYSEAARRAEALYRQLDDSDRLAHALLIVATLAASAGETSDATEALLEVQGLVSDNAPLRKQAALAEAQGTRHLFAGASDLAIEAFHRQLELSRQGGSVRRAYIATGNIGSVELAMGHVDAAIGHLRESVTGLRSILPTDGLELYLGTLAVALAWRGADGDVLPLAREAFDQVRPSDAAFAPLMAAALQHASRDPRRAVLLAGYAYGKPNQRRPPCLDALPMLERVRDRAGTEYPSETVRSWLHSGERLTQSQAAAIAFEYAPLG